MNSQYRVHFAGMILARHLVELSPEVLRLSTGLTICNDESMQLMLSSWILIAAVRNFNSTMVTCKRSPKRPRRVAEA